MRGPKKATEDDRRTAWRLTSIAVAKLVTPGPSPDQDEVELWIEEGREVSERTPATDFALELSAEIGAERKRAALEVALALGKGDGFNKNDHVRVADRHSRHCGKSGLVWFVRDGRVMVSMAEPRSIGGSVSDSFLPEHLEHMEDPVPVNLERAVLLRFMRENAYMSDNLASTQERCTALLLATRSMRQKIVELGGEDPGPP